MQTDRILIHELELESRIGITAEERSRPQRLLLSVEIETDTRPAAETDELSRTIDYAVVADRLRELAAARERNLIETLAEEVARCLLEEPVARAVTVDLRKFALPRCGSAAVRIHRR